VHQPSPRAARTGGRVLGVALVVLVVAAGYVVLQLVFAAASGGPVTWTPGLGAFLGGLLGWLTTSWVQRRRPGSQERQE
jgi:membrane associated rhomboid family serine protease